MESKEWIQEIKSALIKAWGDKQTVTIPTEDILNMEVISLWGGGEEAPVLRVEIPLLVDENGFRFSVGINNSWDAEEKKAYIEAGGGWDGIEAMGELDQRRFLNGK